MTPLSVDDVANRRTYYHPMNLDTLLGHWARGLLAAGIGFLSLFTAPANAQSPAGSLLAHLAGPWQMRGTVMKKDVAYDAQGEWILRGGFLSLHMADRAVPSTYEATLFLGVDSARHQFVGHWLDMYGGAGARVTALGPYASDKIAIVYPYDERRFRNTLTFDSTHDSWHFLIEAEQKEGIWSTWADYVLSRPAGR